MPNSKELSRRSVRLPEPRDIALELARRAARSQAPHTAAAEGDQAYPYVIRVSDPVTRVEQLQLRMVRVLGRPIAIMPHPCESAEEWTQRYAKPPD
jgi:hypothetical protein